MSSRDDDATAATKREGREPRTVVERERTANPEEERLAHGTLVGRYVVMHTLGAGGMGVVYAARDPELDRKVAIKLLQARPGGSEAGGQTWLLREAQAMARLAHPNVVAVYDMGAIPGDRVFVAMELVEGVTLRQWLKQPRSWREIVAKMREAGAGLAAAHAAGLIHRDFKPDNVLVGDDGRARVMDFGLARLHDDEPASRDSDLQIESRSPLSERLTVAGTVLGTPAYMAPEIYRGEGAGVRADQFAFGVALYEALYATRPFDRGALVDGTAVAPKPPAAAKVPAWLERVVLRAISLEPTERYASMDAMLADLAADPTASRRRLAIGAAVILACGGAVAAALVLRGETPAAGPELCSGAAAELAGTWDAPTRGKLEAAFRTVNKPFVADAIRGTEKVLDGYAKDWVAMHTETCKATRVLGTQSDEVLTLRMQCLEQRRVELKTLVDLFATADQPLILGAITSAQKLSPLGDCADVPALLAPDPLPKDPAARKQIVDLQAKLAEARAIYKAAKPKETLAITESIAPAVEATQHKPTQAALHFLRGQALWVLQGAEKGEPELQKAVFNAESGKADELAVETWLQLTNMAIEAGKFEVALERWNHANASLTRLGGHWEMQVRALASKALLSSRQSKYDDALATMKEARAIADKRPESPSYGYALLVEATILNAASRPKEALEAFNKVLDFQANLGHDRIEVVMTIQTMATAEAQLGLLADALAHSTSAVEITESIYGPDSLDTARALSTLGAVQGMNNQHDLSLATNQRALEITKKTVGEKDELYASILGQLAGTLVSQDKPKEALAYLERAEAIQTANLGAGHVQTLTITLTKCDAQLAAGDHKTAIATCERAVTTAEKTFGKDAQILYIFLGHMGAAYLEGKMPKKAVATFQRALALGANDPSDLYFVALQNAEALWQSGDKKAAIVMATKARDGYAKLGPDAAAQLKDAETWLAKHRR